YSVDESISCTLPHNVNFTATTNAPDGINWFWDFGDGTNSTEQNPSNQYQQFGTFPVMLVAEDSNGCTDTLRNDTVQVIETLALLAFDELGGCAPHTFTLNEASNTSSTIVAWNWEIIDPNGMTIFTSTDEHPTTTINDIGLYDIVLTVTDALGCSSSQSFENILGVGSQVTPNFEANPLQACINNAVNFFDLSSSNADYWIWDFGDGATIEGVQNPSHEYLDTGFFDVTLFVFSNGCGNEITFEDYIYVSPPVGRARAEFDCTDPFRVEFRNMSIGADSAFWDFGIAGLNSDTSSIMEPEYTFPDTGCYRVAMTVFNFESGCSDTDTVEVCVTDPQAIFDLDPLSGCVPLTLNVTNQSISAETYLWQANGGIVSNPILANPSITFSEIGIYDSIQLIVTDIHDCTDTTIFNQPVIANGVDIQFNPDPMGGCIPLTVAFQDNSTSLIGTPIQWEWVIGDDLFVTNEPSFEYTFDTLGSFPVQLSVSDDQGCQDTLLVFNAVEVTQPVAFFEADTLSCTADMVQFVNLSTAVLPTYLWDFGDNTTSTEENPQHNYTQQGIYTVCLTVTDAYGCDSTTCRQNYIEIADPVAAFTVDASFADCPPLLTQFQNNSQNATAYEWDFGDNSGFSNLENPPHVYTIPGTYDVRLVAIATESCRDTLIIEDLILLQGPVGEFSFAIDTSCVPLKVSFSGNSADLYDYVWDFGNGVLDTTLNVVDDAIEFTYEETGAFVPKLILIDDANCMRALESPDTIFVEDLEVDFMASDLTSCNDNTPVSFINLSTSTAPIVSSEWIFEGIQPSVSTAVEPQIIYEAPGAFDVGLIVDIGFCRDTLTQSNFIQVGEVPTAAFSMSDTLDCAPLTVDFTDASSVSIGAIANWLWNFGDSTQSNQTNPQYIFTQGNTYDVSLIVETDLGCQDTAIQSLEVLPSPEVNFPDLPAICQGEQLVLTAQITGDTFGAQFYWLPEPSLSCTQCFDPIASPLDTTVYRYVWESAGGCTDTIPVTVNVLPFAVPIITLTADTTICANDLVQLSATGGDDVFSYRWDESRPGLSCYEFCQNPVAEPEISTVYVLTITNSFGCSARDSVAVGVIDAFQPIAGPDRTICAGDSVQLQATAGNSWEWLNPQALTCAFCANPFAYPDSSRSYVLQAIDQMGCTIQDTVLVNVLTADNIDAGEDVVLCRGDVVELSGVGSGLLSWSPTTGLDDPGIGNPVAQPESTTVYTLQAENDLCVLLDSLTIQIVAQTELQAMDLEICLGDTMQLMVDGQADQYQWSPASQISDVSAASPSVWPSETSTYTLIGQLSTCAPDTLALTVEVDLVPAVSLTPIFYFVDNQPIQIRPTILDDRNYQFEWFPTDSLSCTNCPNPTVTLDTSQTYQLLVTDLDTGCERLLETRLERLSNCPDDLIYVPNAFSPNDDGINDELKAYSATINQINTFQIFDRWGEIVFQTNNMDLGWNGNFRNQTAAMGVYIYFLEAPCPIDPSKTIFLKGDITLLR
ncbi:MAG: PKD domain-containing protein, partial [Bacteroidota bacterium]